jgi:gamma-tubulin complex component 3
MVILPINSWKLWSTSFPINCYHYSQYFSTRPSLARPANTLYRHNLTATLETAIRSSNAQNDPPDVLRRLDARMLEYTHGEIGWDVFTLEYKVDAPIDTVLDPDSMTKYLRLFNHLWKMKRIEGALSKGWLRVARGARSFLRVPG